MRHVLRRVWFWLNWPGLYVYFSRSRRVRVVIERAEDGAILLVQGLWKRWYDDPGYGLPGGGLKPHESPADAAVRELAEELGLQVRPTELVPIGEARVQEYGLPYQAHFFTIRLAGPIKLTLQSREIVDIRWVKRAALATERCKPEVLQALAAGQQLDLVQ